MKSLFFSFILKIHLFSKNIYSSESMAQKKKQLNQDMHFNFFIHFSY